MSENIAFETFLGFYRVKASTNCQNATRVTVSHHVPALGDPPAAQYDIPGGANFQGAEISKGGPLTPPSRHVVVVETRRTEQSEWHNLCALPRAWKILIKEENRIVIGFNDWVPFGGAGASHDNVIVEIEFGITPFL
jgi:hypothetical protein